MLPDIGTWQRSDPLHDGSHHSRVHHRSAVIGEQASPRFVERFDVGWPVPPGSLIAADDMTSHRPSEHAVWFT